MQHGRRSSPEAHRGNRAHAQRSTHRARRALGLFKLRIGVMIMITALVGLAVTPGAALGIGQVVVLALSVLVASASAGAFNQYYEHDIDRLMARTRGRAFVTGALPHYAGLAGADRRAAGRLRWRRRGGRSIAVSALYVFLGAFFYAVVYTVWLKRRTWLNIVIGGLAGSFAVLAGAAAVDPALGPLPLLLALVLFLWTPPHFWSLAIANQRRLRGGRRADAAGGGRAPRARRASCCAAPSRWSRRRCCRCCSVPGWIYLAGAAGGRRVLRAQGLAAGACAEPRRRRWARSSPRWCSSACCSAAADAIDGRLRWRLDASAMRSAASALLRRCGAAVACAAGIGCALALRSAPAPAPARSDRRCRAARQPGRGRAQHRRLHAARPRGPAGAAVVATAASRCW